MVSWVPINTGIFFIQPKFINTEIDLAQTQHRTIHKHSDTDSLMRESPVWQLMLLLTEKRSSRLNEVCSQRNTKCLTDDCLKVLTFGFVCIQTFDMGRSWYRYYGLNMNYFCESVYHILFICYTFCFPFIFAA